MLCTHIGKLPLRIRMAHRRGELTHTKCPTCGRIVKLGKFSNMPRHTTNASEYKKLRAKAWLRKLRKLYGLAKKPRGVQVTVTIDGEPVER